jgi:Zn-dependent alcohol dehydrogenase
MKRATVIHTLNELPKEFELDELLEKLIVLEKIDAGLQEAKEGKTIEHEKVKTMAAKWSK